MEIRSIGQGGMRPIAQARDGDSLVDNSMSSSSFDNSFQSLPETEKGVNRNDRRAFYRYTYRLKKGVGKETHSGKVA